MPRVLRGRECVMMEYNWGSERCGVGEVGSRCRGARMPSTSVLTVQQDCCSIFFSIARSAYSFDLVFDGI
jgi:hypothetical protein